MKEDISKLPMWARHRIEKLEADIMFANGRLAEVVGEYGETNVVLPYYLVSDDYQHLPNDCPVQFNLPNPNEANSEYVGYVEIKHNPHGGIKIHGSHPITIEPGSSNVCTVKLRKH